MSRSSVLKKERHEFLTSKIKNDPFLTDEELAEILNVSIPTIRLDRTVLRIPELRERIKNVAEDNRRKVKSLMHEEIVGELMEINLNKSAVSIIETDDSMAFERTKIIRGQFIYSFAESTAIAVIDAKVALVGVANIKYKIPVISGEKLIAKAEVRKIRENNFIVWVEIFNKNTEVFRGKFILVTVEENK